MNLQATRSENMARKGTNSPTSKALRGALERLCKELGDMPHDWPSRELYKAYSDAVDLLEGKDEFTERFMGRGDVTARVVSKHEEPKA